MTFNVDIFLLVNNGKVLCFETINTPTKKDAIMAAYKAVRRKMMDFADKTEIHQVKINDGDVTDFILQIHKDYDVEWINHFDKEIPF